MRSPKIQYGGTAEKLLNTYTLITLESAFQIDTINLKNLDKKVSYKLHN